MDKILSVSVAAYNAEKYIEKCLNSFIVSGVIDKIEVLVINDGSNDSTSQIAKRFSNDYPNSIFVIDKINGGHGSTINRSIREAHGKFFKVVDADDWVEPLGFKRLVNLLEQTNSDLIVNPYYIVDENGKINNLISCINTNNSSLIGHANSISIMSKYIEVAMHAFTFKTKVLKSMNRRISEKCFYVDTEYTLYPLINVKTIMALDFPVYCYLYGTAEQSMNLTNMVNRREQHLRVLKRILDYYAKEKNVFDSNARKMILRRINDITRMQYVVLFAIPNANESKKEIIQFDKYLRFKNKEIYYDVLKTNHHSMKLLKMLRLTGFLGYKPIIYLLHKMNLAI